MLINSTLLWFVLHFQLILKAEFMCQVGMLRHAEDYNANQLVNNVSKISQYLSCFTASLIATIVEFLSNCKA